MKNAKEIRRFKSQMKHNPTPSERIFADRLKESGIVFKTQMILGFYILDFVVPSKMLVLEIDAGTPYDGRERNDVCSTGTNRPVENFR